MDREISKKAYTFRLPSDIGSFLDRLKVLGKGPMTDFVIRSLRESIALHGPELDQKIRQRIEEVEAGLCSGKGVPCQETGVIADELTSSRALLAS